MIRKPAAPVFKPYVMNQAALLPPSYEEKIPEKHLVRVVNEAVEKIDVSVLLAEYRGGGTSSYHPKMLLKVLVYAYAEKIYSSRRIAKALRENIHFMWISGENCPDFRTINDFRGNRMKGVIGDLFSEVLEYLVAGGYVKLENYFVDGTKIEADANKHKMVWAKRRENYEKRVQEQIQELLKHIEQVNEEEQAEYGDASFGEIRRQLQYKSDWFGGRVVRIDRFYPSSQLCSVCGVKNPGLRLEDREWTCQNCGVHHDRDINAARNIHAEPLRLLNQTPVVATSGS